MFKSGDRSVIELSSLGPFKLLGSSLWLWGLFSTGQEALLPGGPLSHNSRGLELCFGEDAVGSKEDAICYMTPEFTFESSSALPSILLEQE